MDLGCSTGYLLEDLRSAHPQAALVGVTSSRRAGKAHASVPEARLVQADACRLPLADASVDSAVSLNLLEHVRRRRRALVELRRAATRRPGGVGGARRAASVRYYDRDLGHERRYAAASGRQGASRGARGDRGLHLGSVLFPAFALVKGRNRRRYSSLSNAALEERVAADIAGTRDSRAVRAALRLEEALLNRGLRPPVGIRGLTVLRRPPTATP